MNVQIQAKTNDVFLLVLQIGLSGEAVKLLSSILRFQPGYLRDVKAIQSERI